MKQDATAEGYKCPDCKQAKHEADITAPIIFMILRQLWGLFLGQNRRSLPQRAKAEGNFSVPFGVTKVSFYFSTLLEVQMWASQMTGACSNPLVVVRSLTVAEIKRRRNEPKKHPQLERWLLLITKREGLVGQTS